MADDAEIRAAPDSTAVRVALWRAMHVQVDPPPHVLEDEIGLQLAAPDDGWRDRPDMDPRGTSGFRAAIVARARFIEDLVAEQAGRGVDPVRHPGRRPRHLRPAPAGDRLPPAGLRGRPARPPGLEAPAPDRARLRRPRLAATGAGRLRGRRGLVGAGCVAAGFDPGQPAVVASTGVTMYLTKEATAATLRQLAALAPGSTLAMTFLLPPELLDEADRPGSQTAERGARASGTPFISFYTPAEMLALARDAGFARRPARAGTHARRALLRRSDRRPPPVERRGPAGGHHLMRITVWVRPGRHPGRRRHQPDQDRDVAGADRALWSNC